jgi:hypothetical protein
MGDQGRQEQHQPQFQLDIADAGKLLDRFGFPETPAARQGQAVGRHRLERGAVFAGHSDPVGQIE